MARPREFDEEQAVEKATRVFWSQGYKHASMDDLLNSMGIQKGSFYNTFGSKRDLYLRCLERYRDGAMMGEGPFGEVLRAIGRGPAAVREVFACQLDALVAGDECAGCFVASASLEHRGDRGDVFEVTQPSVEAASDALRIAIEDAQAAGAMPVGVDATLLATLFMTMGYGSQVLAVAGVSKEALLDSMDAVFGMMAAAPAG